MKRRLSLQQVLQFFRKDLWSGELSPQSVVLSRGLVALRWAAILVDSIFKDRLMLRASALTYTTMLSIVPFLAVAFSVLKGFGFQRTEYIYNVLTKVFAGQPEVVSSIIEYIDKTNVKALGGLGVGFLFLTVIGLFSNMENTFNAIWGAPHSRSPLRKVADYLSVSLIFPILMVMAISMSTTLQNTTIMQQLLQNEIINQFYYYILKAVPYVSVWIALSFLYIYLPNTHVRPISAVFGGLVAGSIWMLTQWVYLTFQLGVANYNAIYGSFAQLPLFLVWLYVSWVIVLLGAEMSFTFQHYRTFVREARFRAISHQERQAVALACLLELARARETRMPPPTLETLSLAIHVPPHLVREVLDVLCKANMVGRLQGDTREERFGLITSAHSLRVQEVLQLLDTTDQSGLLSELSNHAPEVPALLQQLMERAQNCTCNGSLADLAKPPPGAATSGKIS